MIIPVRCFTCGNVIADKELAYRDLVKSAKAASADAAISASEGLPFIQNVEDLLNKSEDEMKSIEGKVLDRLGVTKMCCRRHMLSSVDCLKDI
jgi:DNA-directed RNA polymerase subunit N (RpoN/RPB10)